jgi:hypothetical protein
MTEVMDIAKMDVSSARKRVIERASNQHRKSNRSDSKIPVSVNLQQTMSLVKMVKSVSKESTPECALSIGIFLRNKSDAHTKTKNIVNILAKK